MTARNSPSAPWIESFLSMNGETVPGPPGRWRRVYREGDVRVVLEWADEGLRERRRLERRVDVLCERIRDLGGETP